MYNYVNLSTDLVVLAMKLSSNFYLLRLGFRQIVGVEDAPSGGPDLPLPPPRPRRRRPGLRPSFRAPGSAVAI